MKAHLDRYRKYLPILVGLLLGLVLVAVFIATRQSPARIDGELSAIDVTVMEARLVPFRLEARGHGVARPTETWQAIANVAGRVVERHPDLESGAMLTRGTLLLALDPGRYELAVADAAADLDSVETELAKLDTEEANTRRLLELEQQRLDLSERDLSRTEKLFSTGTVARVRLDEQRRTTLAQRQAVVSLENTLALLPARSDLLLAQLERASGRLAQAQQDLEDTRFVAPYDLRLGEVDVELHQFVSTGQRLFQADSIAAAEIEARIPFSMMRRLLANVVVDSNGTRDISERIDLDALDAEVELVGAGGVVWKGRVVRVSSGLEAATRAVRVVVRVDWPYRDARPPDRPPLLRNMYARIRISAMSPEPLLAVPASAVHQGELWLLDGEDRLVRRPVEIAFEQNDLAVIAAGLAPGERVVVDDLSAAIQGMAMVPRRDMALEERIAEHALGIKP